MKNRSDLPDKIFSYGASEHTEAANTSECAGRDFQEAANTPACAGRPSHRAGRDIEEAACTSERAEAEDKSVSTPETERIMSDLIERLESAHSLSVDEYAFLLDHRSEETAAMLAEKAVAARKKIYGTDIYVRGLIEFSNICKNDCLYCGIRRSNQACTRYRLTFDEILECCGNGYKLGFRTFVLQGGEDSHFADELMCRIVREIKSAYPDCAVTLSLGERSAESYQALYDAGADRYLLRHETANAEHYRMLHPAEMSFVNRMNCLQRLKHIGYQVGCGFMVGSPYQTNRMLAEDLKFTEMFRPQMCGIGPFIPHCQTPFAEFPAGTLELTCYLLSILRLIQPGLLLPATTALGTIDPAGREKGILAGANVVMPNLSPVGVRKKYELYDNKICTGEEAAECRTCLERRMHRIGYEIVTDRGDYIPSDTEPKNTKQVQ